MGLTRQTRRYRPARAEVFTLAALRWRAIRWQERLDEARPATRLDEDDVGAGTSSFRFLAKGRRAALEGADRGRQDIPPWLFFTIGIETASGC